MIFPAPQQGGAWTVNNMIKVREIYVISSLSFKYKAGVIGKLDDFAFES